MPADLITLCTIIYIMTILHQYIQFFGLWIKHIVSESLVKTQRQNAQVLSTS